MTGVIGIFAKTIGLTPVKTRLAAEVGKAFAEEFYRLSLNATAEVMSDVESQSGGKLTPIWAVAEEEGLTDPQWVNFEKLWTGDGSLGSRLYQVTEQLFENWNPVFVCGSDSPYLKPGVFLNAFQKLENPDCDCVIGPSLDGGFYLLGTKQPIERKIWESVTYSTDSTMNDLIEILSGQNRKIDLLETEIDVDNFEDIHRLFEILEASRVLLPAQEQLRAWIYSMQN